MQDFKNDAVTAIFTALMEHKVDFLDRRKPGQWKGILLALAEAYPEDSREIVARAFPKSERTGRQGKAPKIERMADKYKRQTQKSKLSTSKPCSDCPGSDRVVHSAMKLDKPPRVVKGGKLVKGKTEEPEHTPEEAPWSTPEEVLGAFEGSREAMLAFAQAKDIKLPPNIKDEEKIATRILDHFKA